MATVTLELDEEVARFLRRGDEPIEQAAREVIVTELYRRRVISSGKAAELLGIRRFDFIRRASEQGIPYLDMTEEEWAAEMAAVDSLSRRGPSSPTPAP